MDNTGLHLHPDERSSRSILTRTAVGAGWVIGWRFATRFIGICSTLVLVRLLTPADFGIVSLAMGLIQGLDAVASFGVEGAIIRTGSADRAIYDAGFTINVVRGLLISGVMAAAAISIAHFFNNAELAPVVWVLAAGWAINAFQNIGVVEYRCRLAFDMEFKIRIIPRVLALAVTIPAAFIWRSHWALIGGIVANQVLTVALSYILHPYRPRFGVAGLPQIFGYSFWEWIIGLFGMVGGRADTVIIGRLLGTTSVGIYGIGSEIASLPNGEIVASLCRALFSGFVEEKREGADGAATLLRVLSVLALITVPLNVGLSLVAYPVIALCFGQEWLAAVPLVQLLGIAASLSLFNALAEALFSANAWLKTVLRITVATTILQVVLLLALISGFGLIGGATAIAATSVAREALYVVTGIRRLKLEPRKLLASVARPLIAACCMAAVLNWAGLGWTYRNTVNARCLLDLVVAVGLGAGVYAASLLVAWLAAGRPDGAEADALAVIRRLARR
jgi:O-antigen/teichoic acid export membrane protein